MLDHYGLSVRYADDVTRSGAKVRCLVQGQGRSAFETLGSRKRITTLVKDVLDGKDGHYTAVSYAIEGKELDFKMDRNVGVVGITSRNGDTIEIADIHIIARPDLDIVRESFAKELYASRLEHGKVMSQKFVGRERSTSLRSLCGSAAPSL